MRYQKGFTILEIFIAITISMIILAALLQVFLNSKNVYYLENNFAEIQENSRFASAYLSRMIRLAGYRTPPPIGQDFTALSTLFPSGTPYIAGTTSSGINNSDTITVRFQGSGNGTGTPDGTIRDCLNSSVDSNTIASNTFSLTANYELQCQAINANASPSNNTQILVSGVENMKILYGEDLNNDNEADRYVPSSFPSLNMSNVVSVRISLLMRTLDPVAVTPSPSSYYMLGQTFTPTDLRYFREQMTFTIVLRNLLKSPS